MRLSQTRYIHSKIVVLALLVAFHAYAGVYLVGHTIETYVRWGYPPWAHYVAGALFLSAAILMPFRRTRGLGAISGLCVLLPAAATCTLHGDYAHAIQGVAIIAVSVWVALPRREPAAI